jgi:hypothetical protein
MDVKSIRVIPYDETPIRRAVTEVTYADLLSALHAKRFDLLKWLVLCICLLSVRIRVVIKFVGFGCYRTDSREEWLGHERY